MILKFIQIVVLASFFSPADLPGAEKCPLNPVERLGFAAVETQNKFRTITTYNNLSKIEADNLEEIMKAFHENDESAKLFKIPSPAPAWAWNIEGIIKRAREVAVDSEALKKLDAASEASGTIAHVGWGMDLTHEHSFNATKLQQEISDKAVARQRFFTVEPIGGVYMASLNYKKVSLIGHSPPKALSEKDWKLFLSHWNEDDRKAMAHGLGRGTYFAKSDLCAGIDYLIEDERSKLDLEISLKGLGFAFATVNSYSPSLIAAFVWRVIKSNYVDLYPVVEGILVALSIHESWVPGTFENLSLNEEWTKTGMVPILEAAKSLGDHHFDKFSERLLVNHPDLLDDLTGQSSNIEELSWRKKATDFFRLNQEIIKRIVRGIFILL